jgi:hypothetical protein
MVPFSLFSGYLLGYVLKFVLIFKRLKHLLLPIGFFTVLTCQYILHLTLAKAKYSIDIDALLVCIMAGFVAGNDLSIRDLFVEYLTSMSMYVFIPFFTVVGLNINLPVLISTIGFAVLASIVRAICFCLGTTAGGKFAGLDSAKALRLFMGLLPQAGVSLGLAGIVGEQFGSTFGREFRSTMVGVILVNQTIGPIGCKFLIKYCHEDGGAGHHDGHEMKETAQALNDGHLVVKGDPVLVNTQTDDSIFQWLQDILSPPSYPVKDQQLIASTNPDDAPAADGLGPIQVEGESPPYLDSGGDIQLTNVDVINRAVSDRQESVTNPMFASIPFDEPQQYDAYPPIGDFLITVSEKKLTKGGIEIIDITKNQEGMQRRSSAPRKQHDDMSLLSELVSANISNLTRNTKELFGLTPQYSAVRSGDDDGEYENVPQGSMFGNLISNLLAKDERHVKRS